MRKQNLERRATSSLRWAERVSSTLSLMLGLLPNFGVTITVHKTYPKIRIPSTVQNEQVYAPGLPIYSGEKGEERREERREKREERRQRRVWIGFVLELWELWKMGDDAIGTWEMENWGNKTGDELMDSGREYPMPSQPRSAARPIQRTSDTCQFFILFWFFSPSMVFVGYLVVEHGNDDVAYMFRWGHRNRFQNRGNYAKKKKGE